MHTFRKVLLRAEAQAMVVKYTASETEDPYPYYPPPVLMGGVGEVHGVRPEPCRALCDSSPRGCSTWTIGGQAKREPLEVVLQPPAVLGPGRMPRDEWPAADFLPSALASVSLLLTAVAATPPRGFCTFPTFDSLYVVPGGVVLPYLTFCADDAYLLSADARAMEELPRECVVAHLADLPRDRQTRDAVLAGWTFFQARPIASAASSASATMSGSTSNGSLWMVSSGALARMAIASSTSGLRSVRPMSAKVIGSPTSVANPSTGSSTERDLPSNTSWVSNPNATFSPCR